MTWYPCNNQDQTLMAQQTYKTASGSIATFQTDLTENLISCICNITATGGGGTPSTPISINGFSACDLVACGENLAFNYIDNCNIDASGNLVWNNNYKMYIAMVKQGKTYSTNLGSLVGGYFDKIPVLNDTSIDGTRVITTPTFTATYTGFIAFRANSTDTQVSLKQGTDTTYTAYNGTTHTINFGQTIYGGYIDVVNGKLVITHGYYEITGNENWAWAKSGSYPGGFYTPVASVGGKANTPFLCTQARTVTSVSDYDYGTCFCDGSLNFRLMSGSDQVSDWTNFLQTQYNNGNPLTICFTLPTPIEIQLDSIAILTLTGTNNLFCDTGTIQQAKYILSVGEALRQG